MNIFREIKERHVLQAVGVYVGACWVLIEILDRLVERYLLSPVLTDVFFWGLFSLLPAVVLIAYAHGKPGKDKVTRSEMVGVPINLIATTGLLFTLFSGQHMGATADKVMVMNEDGQEVETYIPKAGFRHSLMLFFWDNDSADQDLDWLQYGITEMLAQDLRQNPYLVPTTAYSHYEWGMYSQLLRAGYNDALDVPESLQREIAADHDQDYLINGAISRIEDTIRLSARMYKPDGLVLVKEYSVSGTDIMSLVDRLSVAIKETLEVPSGGGRLADDMSIAEQYSSSVNAVEHYVQARNQRLINNDFDQAIVELDTALAEDPAFALAGMIKVEYLIKQGRSEEAIAVARSLEPHTHKLSSANKDIFKANVYNLTGQLDKTDAVLRMRVELNPNDTGAYWRLGNHNKWSGQLSDARSAYEKVLELDPNDNRALTELSDLYRAQGDMEQAIDYAIRYSQQRPDDMSAAAKLGLLYQGTGERERARQQFEKAALLGPGTVTPMILLADLTARSGNNPAARDYLDQARAIANNPQQHSLVLATEVRLLEREGRLRDAIVLMEERKEYEQQFNAPLDILFEVEMQILSYLSTLADFEAADALLAASEAQLQPPLNEFMQIGHAFVNLIKGNFDAGQQAIVRSEAILEQFGLEHVRFQTDYARGLMAEMQHDYSNSAEFYQQAIDRIQSSIVINDLSIMVVELYSGLARVEILSGDMDGAQAALESGFQMDSARAELWAERARLQWQQQQPELARASMNYALAIWNKADPEYYAYGKALMLAAEMGMDTADRIAVISP